MHRHKHIGIGKIKEHERAEEHYGKIGNMMHETKEAINKKGNKMIHYGYDYDEE